MQTIQYKVLEEENGKRLDILISEKKDILSRSQAQNAIKDRDVQVNNLFQKPSYRVSPGDIIDITIKDAVPLQAEPEDIYIEIIYEDSYLVVVNKPAGMVVHPGCGNFSGTMVNALLYHCKSLSGIGGVIRPGIVHRLDKGTSGVLVVAKNDLAHQNLSEQFKQHTAIRKYKALVFGRMDERSGTVKGSIGRHRLNRKKMSIKSKKGRDAITHWEVIEEFDDLTFIEAKLETGRTHQVRVHLESIGHSIAGDNIYGSSKQLKGFKQKLRDLLKTINRPLLHAGYLEFIHPINKDQMSFEVPLPHDFVNVLNALRSGLEFH